MMRQKRSLPRLLSLLATAIFLVISLGVQPAAAQMDEGTRRADLVLVAPIKAAGNFKESDEASVLPNLIAEALGSDGDYKVLMARDLASQALMALQLPPGAVPTLGVLTPADAVPHLLAAGVRVVLFPEISRVREGVEIEIEWKDLVGMTRGSVSQRASRDGAIINAAGRAASAARAGWETSWKSRARKGSTTDPGKSNLTELVSASMPAVLAWSLGRDGWSGGGVPAAEKNFEAALGHDPGFDLARVDLAWIRFGQGRLQEALELSGKAREGRDLSRAARATARIISGAAGGTEGAGALHKLGEELGTGLPGSWLGSLAEGIAFNLEGKHAEALTLMDESMAVRPNDPVVLHNAGMAALGFGDYFDSIEKLERVAAMWPEHDRIIMDLAEAKLRARDEEGAQEVLAGWAARFDPARAPIWGGNWSYREPPPPVCATALDLLKGSVESSAKSLEQLASRYKLAGAPVPTRIAVVRSLHEFQMALARGQELHKQRWLNGARRTLRELDELMNAGEKTSHPWVLSYLRARLLIREGRTAEAESLRVEIMKASQLPGYDPGLEAELDTTIAFKTADAERLFVAANRTVSRRGTLQDTYQLAQAYGIADKWDDVEIQFRVMKERIEYWSLNRREDSILSSPMNAGHVPFIYSVGAQSGVWRGEPDVARERFSIFLAYFSDPDPLFKPFYREALERGAHPAW
jgi:tetratricopeptide (TPR) repeat protein